MAAIEGAGIIQTPDWLAGPALRAGELVEVLPVSNRPAPVWASTRTRKFLNLSWTSSGGVSSTPASHRASTMVRSMWTLSRPANSSFGPASFIVA